MNEINTRIKILPTIFKLFVGTIGIFMLTVMIDFIQKLINDPTGFNLISVLMYLFLGCFFLGSGLTSIKTFSINQQTLTERVLGLFKTKTDLKEVQCYSIKQASNAFGAFDQIILNKIDGQTIFIDEFDQMHFKEFRAEIERLVLYDSKAKPNYWTKFYRMSFIYLGILIGLLLMFIIVGK